MSSSTLDFLYPKGATTAPPTDVELHLPVRVGIAFAPAAAHRADTFTEDQKQALLGRVAAAFEEHEGLQSVQVIPTSFLRVGGGFENLDRLVSAFGIDVIALVSYDQFQFSDTTRKSWTYWTLIGAYVVKGEKNETRTLMDATIVSIPSRALLFTASGQSVVTGKATPIDVAKELREASTRGFEEATEKLIAELDLGLEAFQTQALTGTVRGQGTPAIAMYDETGQRVTSSGGAGASGWVELAAVLILLGAALRRQQQG